MQEGRYSEWPYPVWWFRCTCFPQYML